MDEPGIAIQLPQCLDALDQLSDLGDPDGDRPGFADQVEEGLREQYPDADIRLRCLDGRQHIGIWHDPVEVDEHLSFRERRRERSLAALDLLAGRNRVAFRVTAAYVRERVDEAFEQSPKRFDTSGRPDEDGPVRLRYFEVDLVPPDLVETTIGVGYKSTDYRIRVEDRLSVGHGPARPVRSATEVKVRPKPFKWTVSVLNVFREAFSFSHVNPKSTAGRRGAGRELAAELPPQFLLAGTQSKLALAYDELTVTEARLDTWAAYAVVEREPAVTITGPSQVHAAAPEATFTARLADLREPTVRWSLDGEQIHPTRVEDEIEDETEEKVSIPLLPRSNHTYVLTATATDEDGGRAEGRHRVRMVAVSGADRGHPEPHPGSGAGRDTEPPHRPPLTP